MLPLLPQDSGRGPWRNELPFRVRLTSWGKLFGDPQAAGSVPLIFPSSMMSSTKLGKLAVAPHSVGRVTLGPSLSHVGIAITRLLISGRHPRWRHAVSLLTERTTVGCGGGSIAPGVHHSVPVGTLRSQTKGTCAAAVQTCKAQQIRNQHNSSQLCKWPSAGFAAKQCYLNLGVVRL